MQKPTRACVYPRVTQPCTLHSTHVPSDDAVAIITKDAYKWDLGIMMVIIPLHVFFQCPQQAPTSQHSQGYKLKFVMLAYHAFP